MTKSEASNDLVEAGYRCALDRIAVLVGGSQTAEDPTHAQNTLDWVLLLDPRADPALRLAAYGHDLDRAVEDRRVRKASFADYDEFKAAHAENSARILSEILSECGLSDELIKEVGRLVRRHETGGDPRSDLLNDADSLSFFQNNLPLFYDRHGRDETRFRAVWGYRRLSPGARVLFRSIRHGREDLDRLLDEVARPEAESGRSG